jgi:hypothetical protein
VFGRPDHNSCSPLTSAQKTNLRLIILVSSLGHQIEHLLAFSALFWKHCPFSGLWLSEAQYEHLLAFSALFG